MPKGAVIGNTGDGKTLAVVLWITNLIKKEPSRQIYANFHINLQQAHFSPYMFLPFEKMKNSIVIYDDVSNTSTVDRFTKTCANRSRKYGMYLIFTGQYDKMIPKAIREILDFRLLPKLCPRCKNCKIPFNKRNCKSCDSEQWLQVTELWKGKRPKTHKYTKVFDYINKTNLYKTNEVVPEPLESDIIKEIIRLSNSKKDVERNLMLYSGNYRKRKRLFKKIIKKMQESDKLNENEKKERIEAITTLELRALDYSYIDIGKIKGIATSTAHRWTEKRKAEIYEIIEMNEALKTEK